MCLTEYHEYNQRTEIWEFQTLSMIDTELFSPGWKVRTRLNQHHVKVSISAHFHNYKCDLNPNMCFSVTPDAYLHVS